MRVTAFQKWAREHGYVTVQTYRRYATIDNYMVVPIEMSGSLPERLACPHTVSQTERT
jgi:hypothetical protein